MIDKFCRINRKILQILSNKDEKVTGKTTTKWEKVTGKITEKVKK